MTSGLRQRLRRLLQAGSSNHEIALGLAVGVCVSFFPVYGPQLLACAAIVAVFRNLNRAAVFLGVQFSWLYPLVLYIDYRVGRLLLPGDYPALGLGELREGGLPHLARLVRELFPMLLLGSVVAGAAAALATYAVARALLALLRKERHPVEEPSPAAGGGRLEGRNT
ncbi:MAG: DUF2062 domain-containing protein [bacterium]|nr:DUF2062 domain-containing protein [bacterium]